MDIELRVSPRHIDGIHPSNRIIGVQASHRLLETPRDARHQIATELTQNCNSKKPATCAIPQRKDEVQLPRDVNKRNLFVKLGLFFNEPDHSHAIVEQLLDDQLNRGLTTIDKLISELDEYCSQFYNIPNNSCRSFLFASFKTITWCYNSEAAGRICDVVGRMEYLVQHHAQALSKLLHLICKPEFCSFALFIEAFPDAFKHANKVSLVQSGLVLRNMEAFLDICTRLQISQDGIKFVDMTLSFGETLLIAAARSKRADTVALLLSYGAKTEGRWLSFLNCVEVLLFAPNMVHIDKQQLNDIEACLQQVLKSTKYINIKHLRDLSKDYYPVTENWEELLRTVACIDEPPSLKHICRWNIRQTLNENWSLPKGVYDLPVPKPIQKYLDITIS